MSGEGEARETGPFQEMVFKKGFSGTIFFWGGKERDPFGSLMTVGDWGNHGSNSQYERVF